MRAFVAVELSEAVRESLGELERELAPRLRSARFVPPGNLHLTLRFLGETPDGDVARLVESVRSELAEVDPFALTFRGLGAFPDPRRPRVLWVGVPRPPEALFAAQSLVERAARSVGLPPEERPFAPHLTLARFKSRERGLADLLDSELGRRELGTVPVSEIACFESRLGPRKASYRAVAKIPLGSGQGSERLL